MQEMYSEDPRVWNAIFEIVTADLASCEAEGIELVGGRRFYPIVLGTKGDWSYLATGFELEHFIFSNFQPRVCCDELHCLRVYECFMTMLSVWLCKYVHVHMWLDHAL